MYKILGVEDGVNPAQLREAYLQKVKENHPDVVDDSKGKLFETNCDDYESQL